MKTFVIALSLLFVLFGFNHAQIDSTALYYYPLQDGNYWEIVDIIEDHWYFPYLTTYRYYSQEVIGDSVMPNGNTYKTIKQIELDTSHYIAYIFERIDTTTYNVYRYEVRDTMEYLIDSLNILAGDSSLASRSGYYNQNIYTICTDVGSDTILNQIVNSKYFYEKRPLNPITYKLSQGLGLTYLNYYFDFGQFTSHLLYANIDGVEYGTRVNNINNHKDQVSTRFKLFQNYPNPFNATTIIPFYLNNKSDIKLTIYDLSGKKIKTLYNGSLNQGTHKLAWDGTNQAGVAISSGVYVYKLEMNSPGNGKNLQTASSKLILLK